jgi:hypothetical protein
VLRAGRILVALTILGSAATATAQSIDQQIRTIYAFAPHELSSQGIDEKSKVLDAFWAQAKARRDLYLPVLRSELARKEATPFFLYDGSMLLLSLSDSASDRRVALAAIARCDLRDVQHTDYFRQVHRLASLGEDITEAALHILSEPKFKAVIPQHALTLGQDYALVYMLLPADPAAWLPRVLTRLTTEKDPTAQKSLLLVAWYAQTTDADRAIAAFTADRTRPEESRKYGRELSSRTAGFPSPATATFPSEEALRTARRELMKQVSDEALIELDQKTAQLAARRK